MSVLTFQNLRQEPNAMASIGSVENVISGMVPPELKNRRFLASKVLYGFELGSPQGIYNLGEAILFNDLLYSSRTDATRSQRDPLMWGPEFVTSGIFLVPRTCEPNLIASYCTLDEPLTLREIYRQIYAETQAPFALAGCAELEVLHSRSITYSPIEQENIFQHEDKYYTEEAHQDPDRNIALVGVVSDFSQAREQAINDHLRKVLYYNPFNKQSGTLISHTHAAVLNQPVLALDRVQPHHVSDVIHLMDDSLVRSFRARVFTIADIVPYEEPG